MSQGLLSTAAEVRRLRDELAAAGRRLVFTNGVFDLLHAGHVRYLTAARALGDALAVALNSDASVRALKGPTRPINPALDRAEVLLGLRSVDAVVVFDGERCTGLIETIKPHLYAKGGDYSPASLNREEKAALEAAGSEIHILPMVEGKSTSAALARLGRSATQQAPAPLPRLAVLGSGRGSNFEAILSAIRDGSLAAHLALVISDQADSRILQLARDAGIPAIWVDPGPFKTKLGDPAQKEVCDRLRASGADLIVLAGFMRRLKDPVLAAFPDRIVNIHPSLLPAFPGRTAWTQALEAGVAETGCSVHLVDTGLDSGRVLARTRVPIFPTDDAEAVRARINAAEQVLYPQALGAYLAEISREST